MKAMVLEKIGSPLILRDVPSPIPKAFEVRIKIKACGVCRTDLHIIDGELPSPVLPLILGHQIVGIVDKTGKYTSKHKIGDRVGIPWLGGSCHTCEFCLSERENLCDRAIYNGYSQNGGYAEYATAHEDFTLPLPSNYDDLHLAPLLCAGLIGYRALRLACPLKTIGFYGFGSSAHLLTQLAKALGYEVYAFTRPGDKKTQTFALSLGATWSGGSNQLPPTALDAALIFAPEGALYPQALKAIKKGGKVISAGIHMKDIPSFPYSLLWGERSISSVANLTRKDGVDFMNLVKKHSIQATITSFPLEKANQALDALRKGSLNGSVVLNIQNDT